MSNVNDITEFKIGEDIQLSLFLTDRPIPPAKVGLPLTDAATQTVSFVISDAKLGTTLYEATTVSEITLFDAPTAQFDADFPRAAIEATLSAEVEYHYDVWSTPVGGSPRLHQQSGTFMLGPSTSPA